jgi:hypothetical protein
LLQSDTQLTDQIKNADRRPFQYSWFLINCKFRNDANYVNKISEGMLLKNTIPQIVGNRTKGGYRHEQDAGRDSLEAIRKC